MLDMANQIDLCIKCPCCLVKDGNLQYVGCFECKNWRHKCIGSEDTNFNLKLCSVDICIETWINIQQKIKELENNEKYSG